ncbi:hypothetical protein [Fulvivirga ligni]|uniref:hypothetical protein n=1 Tax=Fulvivirga ligni TaxID=2904246 RepID=UPI001F43B4E4|nr:hypothetical protein [Fulvivirga ligni]UII22526.1 hypothetical protein LVD16_04705 [Fulvivirga ligni]
MKDHLKETVQNRREEFEIYKTDFDQMWDGIDKGLNTRKIDPWHVIGKIAAAVIVAVGLGFLVWSISTETEEARDGFALHEISPELAETEYFYSQQVAEKLQYIKASDTGVDQEVMQNLSVLDSAYSELKNDLKDNADNEEVIDAMITNYRIKLQILEQIISEIRKHKEGTTDDEINI